MTTIRSRIFPLSYEAADQSETARSLRTMLSIAQILKARRTRQGALSLSSLQPKFKKPNSQTMDQLLSTAYTEFDGSKPGDKELAFIAGVFDFLGRQSTYLSDKKVADKLLKLTKQTIADAAKKKEAVSKKRKKRKKDKARDKVFTKADKCVDKEAVAAKKKKLRKKIKDGAVTKDTYSTSSKKSRLDDAKEEASEDVLARVTAL